MTSRSTSEPPPSLLGATVRRSMVVGRIYLIVGTGLTAFYSVVLSLIPGTAYGLIIPVLIPILVVVGGLGGLMVFTNDRLKGVFEYLLAYGVSPRQVFLNVLVSGLALVSIVLGVALTLGLSVYAASGHKITAALVAELGLYSIPMSYASVAFTAAVGVFWTSLSSPRAGINSPIGVLPIVGVAPALLTLAVLVTVRNDMLAILASALALMTGVVVGLLSAIDRLLPRERFLSPA